MIHMFELIAIPEIPIVVIKDSILFVFQLAWS